MAWLRPIARSPLGLLLLVAVAAVVAQGGSVPHTHAGIAPGFYNQDHDGALLATLHGVATVSAAPPTLRPTPVLALITPVASDPVDSAPHASAPSRAPPHA
jgi:hypothetical protein